MATRKGGSRTTVSSDFCFGQAPAAVPQPPPDPGYLIVEQMLRRVVAATPEPTVRLGSPGSVAVVRTPPADWVGLARDAWAHVIFDGEDGADGERERYGRFNWIWFARARSDYGGNAKRNEDNRQSVAKALYRGLAIVGISDEPEELLPYDLLTAADHRLVLGLPTPEDIHAVVSTLKKDAPTIVLSREEAAGATPRLLRLACRVEQGADDYLRKLRTLIVAETVTVPETPERRGAPSMRDAPTLDRLHGMDEAVAWGFALRDTLIAYGEGRLAWTDVDTQGCLLSGPPGCGKTIFARALAATCDVPLLTGSYGEWLGTGGGHQGDMLRAMRKTFADAKASAPSILFVDEVDSFPNRAMIRHSHADWGIQVVNTLLAEIDGTAGRDGVVLIAACNHPNMLDPALVRSGRIEKHIRITLPNQGELERILREHLGEDLSGQSLAEVAMLAAGASGADCERIVKGARGRARQAKRAMVLSDLITEVGGEDTRSPQEMRVTAVHEAGHALAVVETYPGLLQGVTLRAVGGLGGATLTDAAVGPRYPDDTRRRLMILLGGRAAEEVVFGVASSGAGGSVDCDLAQATRMAAMSIASYGFDEVKGLLWSGVPELRFLPQMLARDAVLADRVRISLENAYRDALTLMRRKRPALEALTASLLDCSALDGAAVRRIVLGCPDAVMGEAS